MKPIKIPFIILVFFLIFAFVALQGTIVPVAQAKSTFAPLAGGDYDVDIKATGNIQKLGKSSADDSGTLTIEPTGTTTGVFDFVDLTADSGHITGTWVSNKTQTTFTLDQNGMTVFEDLLTDWIQNLADDQGVVIEGITWNITKITISKGKSDKNTGVLKGNVRVTASGTVSATVDGSPKTAKFSYRATLTVTGGPF